MDNKLSPRENFLLSQRNSIADRLKALSEDQTPNKCKEAELERLRRRMAELDAELWPDGNKTEEMPWANNDNSFMPWDGAKSDDSLSESDLRELGRKDAQESPWNANETYSAYMSGISCDPSWQPAGVTYDAIASQESQWNPVGVTYDAIYEDAGQDGTDWISWEDAVKEDAARKCSGGEILDVPPSWPRKIRGPGVSMELVPCPPGVPNKIIMKHAGEPMTECNWKRMYEEFVDELQNKRRNKYMDTDVRNLFYADNKW